jgi:uncharacterized membrane protein YvlD (DUF360 family)
MIGKMLRGYVEGLGSKTIAFVVMAIVAALVAPILFSKFGIPVDVTHEVLYGLGAATLTVVLKQLVVDVKSNGATTTQYLMTKRALQELEAALPDGSKLDSIVREVLLAMNRAQVTGGVAGATQGAASPPAA